MIRLGLCCIFRDEPIKFANTTATAIGRLKRTEALMKLARLCTANAEALLASLGFCADHGIGCFRINSQILPLKTHPLHGYDVADLPGGDEIVHRFKECDTFAKKHRLRTSFHPDQFVVLNSPRLNVVVASLREIEYQAEVAEWVGADVPMLPLLMAALSLKTMWSATSKSRSLTSRFISSASVPTAKKTSPGCPDRYFLHAATSFFLASGELSLSEK